MRTWAVGLVALVLGLVCTPVAMTVARRAGVVDRPGPLKRQHEAVPYLGGAAVFVAAAVGLLGRPVLLAPLAMALALGVADDVAELPPWFRLGGAAVVGVVLAALVPTRLPGPAGPLCVVAATMLLVNGVNLLDGLDALATGVVAAACGGFALLLHGTARQIAVAFAFALVGFLVYNRPPARIYLGDGGAYLLGAALAVLLAQAWAPGRRPPVSVASLLLVAIPAAEVAFAVVRRLRGRHALFSGDRGHPYDRLTARGMRVGVVSLAYAALQCALGGLALAVSSPASWVPAALAVVAVGVALVAAAAMGGVLAPEQGAGA